MKTIRQIFLSLMLLTGCGQSQHSGSTNNVTSPSTETIVQLKKYAALEPSFERRLSHDLEMAIDKGSDFDCSPLLDLYSNHSLKIITYYSKNNRLICYFYDVSPNSSGDLPAKRVSSEGVETYTVRYSDFQIAFDNLVERPFDADSCLNQKNAHEPLLIIALANVENKRRQYWFYDFPFARQCKFKSLISDFSMLTPK